MATTSTASGDMEGDRMGRGRPQSIMALQFSTALDSIFGLEEPTDRDLALEEKRKSLHHRNKELIELQARLKAMESKLNISAHPSASSSASNAIESSESESSSASEDATPARKLAIGQPRPATKPQPISSGSEDESEEEEEEEDEEDSETDESTSEESEEEDSEEEPKPRQASRRS